MTDRVSRLVMLNGRVYTQDATQPYAEAVGIVGNRIVAVGMADEAIDAAGPGAERLDVGGRAVLPGFVDAHVHLLGFSHDRERIRLDHASSIEDVTRRVAERAARTPPDAWVLGRGWDHNVWPDRRLPTRHALDAVTGGRPASLLSRDVHAIWANSRALAMAGIGPDTPDPPGGRIVREPDGTPTGVLLESAAEAVRALADRPDARTSAAALRSGQDALARVGVTTVCNFEGAEALRALELLEEAGELRLRVFAGLTRADLPGAVTLGLRTGLGGDRLRIGLLKVFADGALGSGTAAMLAPYSDGPADDRGIATLECDELVELLRTARDAGIGVAVHAIGDAAVRLILDAVEAVRSEPSTLPGRPQILRIEHAQAIDPADIPRFTRLGVVASMQPIHAISDMHLADRRWGARCRTAYAWRSVLDAGALLAFGTDCPVEPPDPFFGVHAAVTRQRPDGDPPDGWYPEQRLTVAQAIHAYTIGSAAAMGLASEVGVLGVGRLADAIVLTDDPYRVDSPKLRDLGVWATVMDGRIVYRT
ncbi:MAG: amidohydrolase [Chloroflexi bacterium]|nr:amidohydrolase [Chloroflexota bacterium]